MILHLLYQHCTLLASTLTAASNHLLYLKKHAGEARNEISSNRNHHLLIRASRESLKDSGYLHTTGGLTHAKRHLENIVEYREQPGDVWWSLMLS